MRHNDVTGMWGRKCGLNASAAFPEAHRWFRSEEARDNESHNTTHHTTRARTYGDSFQHLFYAQKARQKVVHGRNVMQPHCYKSCSDARTYLRNDQTQWAHIPRETRRWHSSSRGKFCRQRRRRPPHTLTWSHRSRWPWQTAHHHHHHHVQLLIRFLCQLKSCSSLIYRLTRRFSSSRSPVFKCTRAHTHTLCSLHPFCPHIRPSCASQHLPYCSTLSTF